MDGRTGEKSEPHHNMADSGKGRMALIVMWTSTAITLVFVVIRLFTRHFIVHQLGADDAAYFVAGVGFLDTCHNNLR